MTKLDQGNLEAVITNGRRHTYKNLCDIYSADITQSMQIDRTLQKLRKAHKIAFTREGKNVIWHAVQADAPATPAS